MSKFILLMVLIVPCLSWPSGAPEKTCDTLTPRHSNNVAKTPSESPFTLTQAYGDYRPGDRIKVVLKGAYGEPFKGLIVQAYDPDTNERIGLFEAGRGLKTIDSCSAVTHTDNKGKKAATLVWDAPRNSEGGKVAFKCTVVKNFNTFYVGILSVIDSSI